MTREEAVDYLKAYKGEEVEILGRKCSSLRHSFDLTDETVDMAIEALSTEITKCEDCKHFQNRHICQYFSRFGAIETSPEDYCSNGERRE